VRSTLALVLILVAAGCGGGGGSSDTGNATDATDATTEAGEAAPVDAEVFASEYAFAPPFVIFDMPGTYTISLRNDGFEPHNLTIEGQGKTENVQPGDTGSVTVTLKPGVYTMVCTIHRAEVMDGEVVVHDG
jgi:plastocyanin